ncbi:DUF3487 family protein [Vibrio owensii]|uniref:DUF3487 family protein n=1 Tax=Vibrio owensii TaxID=696485 RepID=UPI0018F17E72|nr:DUF3487 family protein [Vibrio owensii]
MSIEKEKTIPVTLDRLDFEPNAFLGFTNLEFAFTCAGGAAACAIPLLPLSGFVFGSVIYGFILSVALGVFIGVTAAARAETLKKGRPSYMLWIDFKRRIQFRGVLGIKYAWGFIDTKKWDVTNGQSK